MKHPILLNLKKQFPTVEKMHQAPAECFQKIDYAFPTYWQHQDFTMLTQDYTSMDSYLCWVEIKSEKKITFSITITRDDEFWLYQLMGAIHIKQIPTGNQSEVSHRLEKNNYAGFYGSPGEYTVTIEAGHHFLYFFAINADYEECVSDPLQKPINPLNGERRFFRKTKEIQIHTAIGRKIFQLISFSKEHRQMTDSKIHIPLVKLLILGNIDLEEEEIKNERKIS